MIITPAYCQMMARYNAWQNAGLREMVKDMPAAELTKDRGAFFGSILGTLNHILWADQMWMSRLSDLPAPDLSLKDSVTLTPTAAVWWAERFRVDGRISLWAKDLRALDLVGDLSWYSAVKQGQIAKPKAVCVIHLFNHQTHHRGQVHALLTQMGLTPQDSDIPFMPDGS
jgi:uncharacterized damage-inducible protein DinB